METRHSGPQTRRFSARTASSRNERSLGAPTGTPAREIRAANQAESCPARQKRQLLSWSCCVLKIRSSRGTNAEGGAGAVPVRSLERTGNKIPFLHQSPGLHKALDKALWLEQAAAQAATTLALNV